jgi:hypothetical protein
MLTFHYHTANGYKSQMTIKKSEYDPDTIAQKIKAHCGAICSGIGQTFNL